MPMTLLALIRAIHFASCLVILGVWVFDRLIAVPTFGAVGNLPIAKWDSIVHRLTWTMLPTALVSGALWLGFVAATMSGLPFGQAIMPQTLSVVWNQTGFGTAWKWRLVFWIATAFLTGLAALRLRSPFLLRAFAWCALLASGALTAGLVWAGHGIVGSPWHRAADLMHLLAAGCWPAGLLPFFCLLWTSRQLPAAEGRQFRWALTRRFSMMSVFVVAVLCATGLVNCLFLVGSISGLSTSEYGRWLVAKILLFIVMVGLGAMNFIRWKPRLAETREERGDKADLAGHWIQSNVTVELLLAVIIVIIVSVLGLLPPPFTAQSQ